MFFGSGADVRRVTKIIEISLAANRTTDAIVNLTTANIPLFGECRNRSRSLASERVSNFSGIEMGVLVAIVYRSQIYTIEISDSAVFLPTGNSELLRSRGRSRSLASWPKTRLLRLHIYEPSERSLHFAMNAHFDCAQQRSLGAPSVLTEHGSELSQSCRSFLRITVRRPHLRATRRPDLISAKISVRPSPVSRQTCAIEKACGP
jgi:hypothetical protein